MRRELGVSEMVQELQVLSLAGHEFYDTAFPQIKTDVFWCELWSGVVLAAVSFPVPGQLR